MREENTYWVFYFWKKKRFEVGSEGVEREFLSERKGKVIPCGGTDDRKVTGTNSGKSGTRNLEAESTESRAESTGGCVNLETVTELRRSSARDMFVAESVCLVSLLKSFLSRHISTIVVSLTGHGSTNW